jgi:tRNA threonylcarbamoyladenosine biosynthesis protein TsaB
MNKLSIDTTDNKVTVIKLEINGKIDQESTVETRSQKTLVLIDEILKRNSLKPKDLDEILVNAGPGSFTGIRVGVAVANALGFSLDKKVNGKKQQVKPKYK